MERVETMNKTIQQDIKLEKGKCGVRVHHFENFEFEPKRWQTVFLDYDGTGICSIPIEHVQDMIDLLHAGLYESLNLSIIPKRDIRASKDTSGEWK